MMSQPQAQQPPTPQLTEYNDISYLLGGDADPLHRFDLYVPKENSNSAGDPRSNDGNNLGLLPLICFVHGGAWRSEDKSDHAHLARRLAAWSSYPVAVPNYRLTKPSSPHKHPVHAQDLLRFLDFLLTWKGPDPSLRSFDSSRLFLLGHSCSAHMLTSIFLASPLFNLGDPSLTPSPQLLRSTRGIALSEGIYDIDLLLRSFPSYKDWFIADTFGDLPTYAAYNTICGKPRAGGQAIKWLIIHSTGDTLVDMAQSKGLFANLVRLGESEESENVEGSWSLTADHNQILREEGYPEIVSRFIKAAE